MVTSLLFVRIIMVEFKASLIAKDGLPTDLFIKARDYQSAWLKLDQLGLDIIELKQVST